LACIDYRPIFEQATKTQTIRHAFVGQEGFDMPWQDSLKVYAEYANSRLPGSRWETMDSFLQKRVCGGEYDAAACDTLRP
jgi:hypothetical protein